MKRTVMSILVLSLMFVAVFGGFDGANAAEAQGKKVLVAFFSRSGTTRGVAEMIHTQVGGDMLEIRAADPYPVDDAANRRRVEQEKATGARPLLAMDLENLNDWDVIFVGHPIWQGELPPVLLTFLEKYDFSGKTVIPFCTYGGSGPGETPGEIAKLTPKSGHLEGFGVMTAEAGSAQGKVSEWLKKIGMAQ